MAVASSRRIGSPAKSRRFISRELLLKRLRRLLAYVLMILVVTSVAFPLIWMLFSSLKPDTENYAYPPTLFPGTFTLDNYLALFQQTQMAIWFRNSLMISLTVSTLAIALSATGAYSLSRFHYRFFEFFSRIVLLTYMVPSVLLLVPIYKIVWSMRLGNSLPSLVLVYNATLIPYGLWTLRSYFAGIPHEIEEAALVDGATRFQAFYKVVLPQALPGLIATAIFAFHVSWNEYLFASVLLASSQNMTLSAGVATLIGASAVYSWGMLMAAGVIVTLPVVLLFGFLQRYLVAGWGGGAVKG